MVLVDASHPNQWTRIPNSRGGRLIAMANGVTAGLAWLGVVRAFHLATGISRGLPDRQVAEMTAILARPQSWSTSSRVLSLWDERTRPEINRARKLGNLPLAVLGVSDQPRFAEELTALQAELPALSTNSIRQVVEGATHESLVAKRENAVIVANAIRRVLESSRTGQPIASIATNTAPH